MNSAITAIGTANPRYKQSQQVAAEMIGVALNLNAVEKRILKSVYRSTGIESRYSVLGDFCKQQGEFEFFPNDVNLPFPSTAKRMQAYKDNALTLAIVAIENCLQSNSDLSLNDVTHLITVSCTGMYAPGIDIELVHHYKLSPNVKRTAVNFMGCYGAFNGMKVADAICKGDPHAKVLMVSVELCTLHFQKHETMDNMISNAIFADGAAAVLIEPHATKQKSLSLETFHCDLLPQHEREMAWHIGDHGFDIVLSTYVPDAIQSGIAAFAERMLTDHQMTLSDIDIYAIHPGGAKILKACESALNITAEDNRYSYQVLKENGNMSSATVLFVLKKIWDEIGLEQRGKKIFSCAFGPGLTLEAMVLKVV